MVVRSRVALRQGKNRKRLASAQAAFEFYHEHTRALLSYPYSTHISSTLPLNVDAFHEAKLRSLVAELPAFADRTVVAQPLTRRTSVHRCGTIYTLILPTCTFSNTALTTERKWSESRCWER